MKIYQEILEAERRIRAYIKRTPLIYSNFLSELCDCNAYLKLESEQITGSFKLRGAFNKILFLKDNGVKKVITASTGNHGVAVSYAGKTLGFDTKIFIPENISDFKLRKLKEYEVNSEFFGNDCLEAEHLAKEKAGEEGVVYISPYNDIQIIAGQGTIGIEIKDQIHDFDSVLVPIGGGGLISGLSVFLKALDKKVKIFGCLPENSPVMWESIKAGKIVETDTKKTLSDATAGGIEKDSITFEICKKYVDDFFLVNEKEIEEAIYLIFKNNKKIVEGAGALPVATLIKYKNEFRNKRVVLVLSGSNIDPDFLKRFSNKNKSKRV
ncbi:MAG: threonine/serine dehydratase [Candidatus Aminicenantia bacterium]